MYQNGKIMFHMSLPYGKVCDSDHYGICTEVSEKNFLQRKSSRARKDIERIMQLEAGENS